MMNVKLYLIKLCNNITKIIYKRFKKNQELQPAIINQTILMEKGGLFKFHNLIERVIFIFSKPIDHYLPFLAKFGTTRVMVFKKVKQ